VTAPVRIGVDVGGTFTDLVAAGTGPGGGWMRTLKVPSTPDDPARGVLEGMRRLGEVIPGGEDGDPDVVHGSTVATNAVLERDGARTAFVATAGFRDLLSIARQDRPRLYDLFAHRPEPLVPRELCFGVEERVDEEGRAVSRPDPGAVDRLAERLREREVESVAVCFLFSFLRPEHERRVAERLRAAGLRVSLSSEVLPEFREYERASTTVADAYVSPVLDRYLARLQEDLPARRLRVMQSAGGTVGAGPARRRGVHSILSGPAGGVVGALHVARRAGHRRAITLDMGGTSTDVSLAEGEPRITTEAEVGGVPVGVPVVDLHTVGSGGGSVARVDRGGALRVGPESAGADPGPACYGRGGERPTVTDAHLVLGRLLPDRFLGGRMELDVEAAEAALERLGREADVPDPGGLGAARAAARGVVRVADARMERALRVISVERGHDPSDFVLVSFGGAGGLHACALARALGIGTVLLPPGASTLSAFGMLAGDVRKDRSRTVMLEADDGAPALEERFRPLVRGVEEELREEGFGEDRISVERAVEMRYRGQSYEIRVPHGPDLLPRFHRRHREVYGHAEPGAPVEVVTLRVRGTGEVEPPPLPERAPGGADPAGALLGRRPAVVGLSGSPEIREVPVYAGEELRPGHRLPGPAVVAREDTTLWLGPGDRARVDRFLNLEVEVGG
jgi:N-methylhydantoinase A